MKVLFTAFALLAPLVLAHEVCYPPQSTTLGFLTLTETHWYSVNDYTNGVLFFALGDDIFGDPWVLVDLKENLTYYKDVDQLCVISPIDGEQREMLNRCMPDDAELYGEIDGHPIYLTDRPGSTKWLMAVTPIEDSPYYWRFISRFEFHGILTDVGFVYTNYLGVQEPSLLEKDLSQCVPAE
ncbi:hypothetical protein RRG08_009219 [Elysia crispata]|uniref:Uncharacterized protein n=1 Tax=Elysia crispata TaxID=231223 RepID=A0AAE0YM00_9GAST|nr:hypothetical protein RRG08_009219 [Elysia crispata]